MRNVAYYLERAARRTPDADAIVHGDLVRSYAQFNERAGRLARALRGAGLNRGDRLGIVCPIIPEALETQFGALRAGLAIVPMNSKLSADEQAYILADSEAKAVVCGAEFAADLASRIDPSVRLVVIGGDEARPASSLSYEALVAGAPDTLDVEPGADGDLAWIFYTSGTTGKPKGAMLSHRALDAMICNHLIELPRAPSPGRLAHLAPLSHAAGLFAFHQVALGGAHVFPTFQGFRADAFYRLVGDHKVTKTIIVPTMIQRLLDDPARPEPGEIASLGLIVYGGAPMYREHIERAIDRFGPIFVQIYGQGEAPLSATILSQSEHLDERKLSSIGREAHVATIRIVDEHDRVLGSNETGEIAVRGDTVMQGYWNRPEATAETLRNGWLHTGDVGHHDEDGYFYITDRKKDVIITGGSNVYPREVEEVLHHHPAVQEACVFGVPDLEWGERIVAAVVPREGAELSAPEIIAWCRSKLASFKKPSHVEILTSLPKNGYGKIMKRELREEYQRGASRPNP